MARAIVARRQGDEYQARIFWLHLLKLRTGDFVESVCFESDRVSFVDDVVVTYREPICERATGKRINCDYYQCKYHVTQGGAFTYKELLDPTFINCKESMLQRLYNAYTQLLSKTKSFRLYIVSNWFWHHMDELSRHLSEERIRNTFYNGGPNSRTGRIRSEFANHLSITESALQSFLDTVRFQLGKNLTDLTKELELYLKLSSLQPIDPEATSIIYDDLAWKLLAQGRNYFDRLSFEKMIYEEKLVIKPSSNYSEISISSFPQRFRRPHDIQAAHLDLCDLFNGRFPSFESYWNKEIPKRVVSFFQSNDVRSLPQPIHLFFDCHLSVAFLVGSLLNSKLGIQIIPAQKTRTSGYEFWYEPKHGANGLWNTNIIGTFKTEVVIAISVTNPIDNHLVSFLEAKGFGDLPIIQLRPVKGVGPKAISDGEYAWQLGFELQTLLRSALPSKCHMMHLFFSGPAALAYIFGNTICYITKNIQLYEYDFEGLSKELRYYPSIRLPIDKYV